MFYKDRCKNKQITSKVKPVMYKKPSWVNSKNAKGKVSLTFKNSINVIHCINYDWEEKNLMIISVETEKIVKT